MDGTTDTGPIAEGLFGWEYENCDAGYVHLVGEALNADIEVLAIAGIGLTQNARAKQQWQLGPLPLPGYYNRTLQSEKSMIWDTSKFVPELVVISLGGNDYNHQKGHVPSNETFSSAYEEFLLRIFSQYGE